jgi:hypothetical protein
MQGEGCRLSLYELTTNKAVQRHPKESTSHLIRKLKIHDYVGNELQNKVQRLKDNSIDYCSRNNSMISAGLYC